MAETTDFEEYPSPFAHPLTVGTSEARSRRSWRVVATTTALCLAFGIGAVLIVAWANHRPAAGPSMPPEQSAVAVAPAKTEQTSAGDSLGQATQETRPSLAYYTQSVKGGLFSAPQPPAPKRHRAVFYHRLKPAEGSPPQDTEPSLLPVTPVDPFVDWSYDGTVKTGDKAMALLENTKTKEGQYVQTGDTFLDARVGRITERSVTLHSADKTYILPKSQKITVVPLDKSAPYLTQSNTKPAQPAGAAPGTPGQTAATAFSGFASLTPEQRAMMRQYWRQYRQMYRNMGGGYGSTSYLQSTTPGGQ